MIKLNFIQTIFSKTHQTKFENIKFKKNSKFQGIIFSEKVLFKNCDLSEVSFLNSNIEKVQFDECTFITDKNKKVKEGFIARQFTKLLDFRKILYDEELILKNKKATTNDFEKVETLYRQFKKNFDNKKDYQMADDFYQGEMEMRLRKFKKEKTKEKSGTMNFLKIYFYLSQFNNSFLLPILWLIIIFFLFFIIFNLTFLYPNFFNFSITETLYITGKSMDWSFTGAIPLLSFPVEIKTLTALQKTAFYLETISSTIVWASLLLSLKRKFKR